jgi:hypothetical protein
MDYINSNKLLFVCALPGGSGYRFGRLLSCFNNVYWYANKRNGDVPWQFACNQEVKGKAISPYHYDRRTSKNMIPLVGERIERYWNNKDLDQYYTSTWTSLMESAGANELISQGQYVSWIVHDAPAQIINKFPNSKIINLIDGDVNSIINRYKETTALFPVSIENSHIKPSYKTEYAVSLEELKMINDLPSYKDLWAWQTFKIPKYFRKLDSAYIDYLTEYMRNLSEQKRIQDTENILTVSWKDLDLDVVKDFLNASYLDKNYLSLLESRTF